jgi:hypothetical protein
MSDPTDWGRFQPPRTITTDPAILTQPNIPKPLHGVAPRVILGEEWWDATRAAATKANNQHCAACGVHASQAAYAKRLEAHEVYKFDYAHGTLTFENAVGLCHYCHNFIHSGRLKMILGREKTEAEIKTILEHGFAILAKAKLKAFPVATILAQEIGAKQFGVRAYSLPECPVAWEDWRMIVNGTSHEPLHKSYADWQEFYLHQNRETPNRKDPWTVS